MAGKEAENRSDWNVIEMRFEAKIVSAVLCGRRQE